MKYVNLENGKIKGWYDRDINKEIPDTSIEITYEEWKKAIASGANYYNGETFVYVGENDKEYSLESEEVNKISRLQAKLCLLDSGYYKQVMDLVEQDTRLKIYWNDAVSFNKDDIILRNVQMEIGLTDEQLDNMFLEASRL